MQDSLTLYKLIVLYMLNEVSFPLTRAQIFDFILEREYCTFFPLQQAIAELNDSGLISSKALLNSTHLSITEEGRNTLKYFGSRIDQAIKREIQDFFDKNKLDFKNEVSVQSDFFKTPSGEYTASLVIREEETNLIRLELTVPTRDAALAICGSWTKKHQEIYALLMDKLMGEVDP